MYPQVFDEVVLEFVRELGAPAQYVSVKPNTYSPTSATATNTTTVFDVKAILLDLTLQSNGYSTKFGTLIQAGDKNLLVQPPHKIAGGTPLLEINPATDKIVFAGITYSIVTYKEINPAGNDPLLFDLYVRR